MSRKDPQLLTGLLTGMGALHFIAPEPFDSIIPPQLPGEPRAYTLASGVAEMVTAGLIAHRRTRKLGGAAAIALFLAVFPANIYVAYQWRNKPWPLKAIAYGRLPLQAVLIKQGWNLMKIAEAEAGAKAHANAKADSAATNH
ncbi:DoxX family protein [Actinotignum sp. GS-2025a]|uniref:DoxX family protein n=1 Tax=Actinotignum sp. GS-2025a TaxID=3427274 RepID=UPI003F46AEA8